ncbi:Jasmonate O-methyltransferase [Striga hermonthica]|uniref:Jasmonate O-methyltransferase n=1 Tax=Striga hermonthica TaxID=68872 RepID=A0A9N7N0F8_STRHE|nr:Jasmonate O-methyltransferase [Striga hermonthica]
MNKGEGENSYARNSIVQKEIIEFSSSVMEELVADSLRRTAPESMGIADLGCSSGPNTLIVVKKIINAAHSASLQMGSKLPELRISLNDLPGNDFNSLFMSLDEFYGSLKDEKGVGFDRCFVCGVAGSFYRRLFPKRSLHFVHSSSSLHWLSQVPPALDKNSDKHMNKGKIYISQTSPDCVSKAYLAQFQKDLMDFLRCRAQEIVGGGGMMLSLMGRVSPNASAEVGCYQWELLAQALVSMVPQGIVREEDIDSLNVPYYAPSPKEVRDIIQEEGSFVINHLEAFEINWDEGTERECHDYELRKSSRGHRVAKTIRAVVEPMFESHFRKGLMDELFARYGQLVDDYFSKTQPRYINLVISMTRKD